MFFSSHQSHRKNRYSCLATHVQKEYGDRRKYIFSHSLEKGDIAKKKQLHAVQFTLVEKCTGFSNPKTARVAVLPPII